MRLSLIRRRSLCTLCALLLLATTSGCTRLIYDNADTVAGWYVGSLVRLDEPQRSDLQVRLKQMLEWHRGSQLGLYAQFLREQAQTVAQPVSAAALVAAHDQMRAFTADLAAKAAPEAAQWLMRLSPAQREQLLVNLEEKSRERAEKELEDVASGSWRARRAKRMQRQFKRWTGRMTQAQREIIVEHVQRLEPTAAQWLDSQRAWRAALRQVLNEPDSPQGTQGRLVGLLSHPDTEWTDDYRIKSARNREQLLLLAQALDATLTPEQRRYLQQELMDLAEHLESLRES